jgi:hypothetical protein
LDANALFSSSYVEARERFRAACTALSAPYASLRHPTALGPDGESLEVDVCRIGPAGASNVLVLISGTHGVEGFLGSACQLGLLRSDLMRDRQIHTAIVLVHALNPFGFAHLSRVNEDNVDINRNFVDHRRPRVVNDDYDTVHPHLIPADWEGPAREKADQALGELLFTWGPRALQQAITGGQYHQPTGLYYGGQEPTWSNRVWRQIIVDYLSSAERVGFIDLHSGLGAYGQAEVIFGGRHGDAGLARARRWYEVVTSAHAGTSTSTEIQGGTGAALLDELPDTDIVPVTLEFGTKSGIEVLQALRGDAWLRTARHASEVERAGVKRSIRDAFLCDAPEWRSLVWQAARRVFTQALIALDAGL